MAQPALAPLQRGTPLRLRFVGHGKFGAFMYENLAADPLLVPKMVELLPPFTRSSGMEFDADVSGDAGVDAVYVCSPDHLHSDHTVRCLIGGKHVLVEKPLTDYPTVVGALHRCKCVPVVQPGSEISPVVLRVGFHRRFDREFSRAKEYLAARRHSPSVIIIESRDPVPAADPMSFVLANSVVHDLDMAVWLLSGCNPGAEDGGVNSNGGEGTCPTPALTIVSMQLDAAKCGASLVLSSAMGDEIHIVYSKESATYRQQVTVDEQVFGYDVVPDPTVYMCSVYRAAYHLQWHSFVQAILALEDKVSVAAAVIARQEAANIASYGVTFALLEAALSLAAGNS